MLLNWWPENGVHISTYIQMTKSEVKEYTNGEVTIIWKPHVCRHSGRCFTGLPEVFDPDSRPWINVNGASTQQIIDQVKKCPSGALTTILNSERQNNEQ